MNWKQLKGWTDENYLSEVFKQLNTVKGKMGSQGSLYNTLNKEYVSGRYSHDFQDRLKTLIDNLEKTLGQSLTVLNGVIYYQNSGGKPAQQVEVSALGVAPSWTNKHGIFSLSFSNKKQGDRVQLMIGSVDNDQKAIEVVNRKQLTCYIPSNSENLVEIIICYLGNRDKAAQRYYGILEQATENEFKKQFALLKQQLEQDNLGQKATATLIAQMDELRREKSQALSKIEEQAQHIASINQDKASELVKTAIQKIEEEKDIDSALIILDDEKLEEAYQLALTKKEVAEEQILQVTQGYELKISLLLPKFQYRIVSQYYDRIIEIYEHNHFDEKEVVRFYLEVGEVFNKNGQYQQALDYLNNAVNIQETVLKIDQIELAVTYNDIAITYYYLGKYKEAFNLNKKTIDIRKKELSEKHPDLAEAYHNIANTYNGLRDYEKALEFHKKTININKTILEHNHPDLATSYDSLAGTYGKLKQYKKSIEFHTKAINIRKATLEINNPILAISYNNIGVIYGQLGKYEKALEFNRKAINIRKNVLEANHPNLAISYNNISAIYLALNQFSEALNYINKSIDIFKISFPQNHPNQTFALKRKATIRKAIAAQNKKPQ